MVNRANPGGMAVEAVAVEFANVPAKGVDSKVFAPCVSENIVSFITVSSGMFWLQY